jgi:hypothetical protein
MKKLQWPFWLSIVIAVGCLRLGTASAQPEASCPVLGSGLWTSPNPPFASPLVARISQEGCDIKGELISSSVYTATMTGRYIANNQFAWSERRIDRSDGCSSVVMGIVTMIGDGIFNQRIDGIQSACARPDRVDGRPHVWSKQQS